jgi:hypothetical protein
MAREPSTIIWAMPTRSADDLDELVATSDGALRQQALRRIKKRRDFYGHVLVLVLANAVVWGIRGIIAATSGITWPWPLFLGVR